MVKIKFYLNTFEIVREQKAALKGIFTESIDLTDSPLPGSAGEKLLLKLKLLNEESLNPQKTAAARSSQEYFTAKDEVLRLNKLKNNGQVVCEYCKSICNREHNSVLRYTIDHVVPLSEGGDNSLTNLKIACRFCNRFKGSMPEDKFLTLLKKGKREEALNKFNEYLIKENLEATPEILADFLRKHRKSKQKPL